MVVIKVSLGDDIRRFSLTVLPSFAELRGMLERLFSTAIQGSFDVKYLDIEGDQITVTSDAELVDALGMASTVGEQKLLRLYLVPKGTSPSLLASTAPASSNPVTAEVDLTHLLSGLGQGGSNGLMNLLNLLASGANSSNNTSNAAGPMPWMREEGQRVHMYYVCDGCEVNPITGDLFQCDVCPDYHLCSKCRDSGVHMDKNHTFTTNPPRRNGCGRWGNRGQHHGHGHHGHRFGGNNKPFCGVPSQQQQQQQPGSPAAPASAPVTEPSAPVVEPAKVAPVSPFVKPPVPVVSAPFTPTKPIGIVETTEKHPIVPQVQVVPVERLEMSFLSDVTMPDGSPVNAGETFNKVWRLSNSGHTTWPLGCRLSLESNTGEKLSSVESIDIPGEVPPGSAVTISVEMEAPKRAGRHVSYWRMHGPSGQPFGNRIWVDIISNEKPAQQQAPAVIAPVQPSAPVVQPTEQYASQLESLYRMGFLNIDLNRNLLEHSKGNLSAVIDQLCQH